MRNERTYNMKNLTGGGRTRVALRHYGKAKPTGEPCAIGRESGLTAREVKRRLTKYLKDKKIRNTNWNEDAVEARKRIARQGKG